MVPEDSPKDGAGLPPRSAALERLLGRQGAAPAPIPETREEAGSAASTSARARFSRAAS